MRRPAVCPAGSPVHGCRDADLCLGDTSSERSDDGVDYGWLYRKGDHWYDLRTSPMTRLSFTFGGQQVDREARRSALLANLLNMLLLEAPDQAGATLPDSDEAREALVDHLVAARGDTPMSADLYEAWRLWEDVR